MKGKYDLCFYERKENELYNQEISSRTKRNTSNFGQLVMNVFRHLGASYSKPSPNDPIYDIKTISYYFYKKHYIEPKITIKGEKEVIPVQDFVNDTLLDNSNGHKNKFSFLVGKVGVGKTSVLNYLITHHEKYRITKNTWFVRLDIDKSVLEHYHRPYHIINSFVEKVCRVIENNLDSFSSPETLKLLTFLQKHYWDSNQFETLNETQKNEVHNLQKLYLKKLISSIRQKCNKKLIIFLDNIDILYFYSASISAEKAKETHDFLTGLMEIFIHDRDHLGSLGANILMVMRVDTFDYLKSFGKISGPIFTNDPYTIIEPSWKKVIDARYDLLKFIIKNDSRFDNKEELSLEVNRLYNYFLKTEFEYDKLINHIRKLTNNGLRELMDYFRNYGWISEIEEPTISRFNKHTHIGLISFVLNGKKVYSQIRSLIPNLYLNYLIPYPNNGEKKSKHINTYWLKYLILQYAIKLDDSGESISEYKIYEIFSSGENSYPRELVKEVIGVLCDPSRFNMFRRTRTYIDAHQYIIHLHPTLKSKLIFNDFKFKFFYLQLILDDHLLALPKIFKENKYNRLFDIVSKKIDYSYITDNEENYSEKSKKIIYIKSKQVLYFIQVLKTSYKIENDIFKPVFKDLKELNILPPDLDLANKNIIKELSNINKLINFTPSFEAFINSILNDCESIENYLTTCYDKIK